MLREATLSGCKLSAATAEGSLAEAPKALAHTNANISDKKNFPRDNVETDDVV